MSCAPGTTFPTYLSRQETPLLDTLQERLLRLSLPFHSLGPSYFYLISLLSFYSLIGSFNNLMTLFYLILIFFPFSLLSCFLCFHFRSSIFVITLLLFFALSICSLSVHIICHLPPFFPIFVVIGDILVRFSWFL